MSSRDIFLQEVHERPSLQNQFAAFRVAETKINRGAMQNFLEFIGAPEWHTNTESDNEELAEVMGRLCYKSFKEGLNPNVTKIREGNEQYMTNIIKQKHGSVMEHCNVTYILCNVSRIFTHELVRHRAGMAFSQESQRFVRLDSFQIFIPDISAALEDLYWTVHAKDKPVKEATEYEKEWITEATIELLTAADEIAKNVQHRLKTLIHRLGIDDADFSIKKRITSFLRRMVPGGVTTNIGVTGNLRAWRHIINMRTAPGAEKEAIDIMDVLAAELEQYYPNFFLDVIEDQHEEGKWHKLDKI